MGTEYLTIKTEDIEYWDDENNEFITEEGKVYTFRYTLRNLDRWETKHEKRFIDNSDNISEEEILDFIAIMCDQDLDISKLSQKDFNTIVEYMGHTPSATSTPKQTGSAKPVAQRKKIFTSEIIYAHMALNSIPFDWEDRNLNKLIVLLNAVASLQEPPKKMTKAEVMAEQRSTIMKRRAEAKERGKLNG